MNRFTVANMFRANVADGGDRPMFRVGDHRDLVRALPPGLAVAQALVADGVAPATGWPSSTATDWPTSRSSSAGRWPGP